MVARRQNITYVTFLTILLPVSLLGNLLLLSIYLMSHGTTYLVDSASSLPQVELEDDHKGGDWHAKRIRKLVWSRRLSGLHQNKDIRRKLSREITVN